MADNFLHEASKNVKDPKQAQFARRQKLNSILSGSVKKTEVKVYRPKDTIRIEDKDEGKFRDPADYLSMIKANREKAAADV